MIAEAHLVNELELQDVKLFDSLSKGERSLIEDNSHSRYYKKGEVIFREGSISTGSFLMKKGVAKIYKVGTYGRSHIINLMKPGDIFAYHSLFSTHRLNTFSAKAFEDSVVCYVPHLIVTKLLQSNWGFTKKMMELISNDLNTSNTFVTGFVQKSLRERAAGLLLTLKEDFGVDDMGRLRIRITRKDMASMVGTVPESLVRTLSDFKRERLLAFFGREIVFLDISRLRKVANL